ncbi:hypothetical protein Prudu_014503, partial [Prunus dulcis]
RTKAKRQQERQQEQHHSDSEELATSQTKYQSETIEFDKGRETERLRSRNGVAVDDTDVMDFKFIAFGLCTMSE